MLTLQYAERYSGTRQIEENSGLHVYKYSYKNSYHISIEKLLEFQACDWARIIVGRK